jgi:hypothetical protein
LDISWWENRAIGNTRRMLFSERINGNYYCYLGEIIGGNARLGSDPELSDDAQELQELKWIPIKEMQGHPEVKRLLPYL